MSPAQVGGRTTERLAHQLRGRCAATDRKRNVHDDGPRRQLQSVFGASRPESVPGSAAELAQMMIHMPIAQDAPVAAPHAAKERVGRPRCVLICRSKALHEPSDRGLVVCPGLRRALKCLGRPLRAALWPRQDVDQQMVDRPESDGAARGSGRDVAERHPELVAEVGKRLRGRQLPPLT